LEAPLQKLARIQREIDELKHDLSSSVSTSSNAETSLLLQKQLSILQDQFQKVSIERMKQQEQLLTSIQTTVARIGEPTSVAESTSSSIPGIIPSSFEERIRHLEVLLGNGSSGNNKNMTLLERLDQLERQSEKLDEKKLDLLHKRAKVIRQDLEAAAKARHKLNVDGSDTTMNAKKIAALYDEMEQLQGLTGLLPSVVSRLQSLAQMHADAATHSARFTHVEQTVQRLQTTMASVEESIETLERSLQTSAKTMQENVRALEQRMNALASMKPSSNF
jgi:nuclear migration protein JNM1